MRRIAIPVTDGQVAHHLGHCQQFLIADVADGKVLQTLIVSNPGHGPGGPAPAYLIREKVDQVVAWGMPPHAREVFASAGVAVQMGATGEPTQVLTGFLKGTLTYTTEGLDTSNECEGEGHEH